MELDQAKRFHQELKRIESAASNSRSITILVGVGLIAYFLFVGLFIDFETVVIFAALLGCAAYWQSNERKAKKYTETLDSYCWSNLGKSYAEARRKEFLL